MSRAPGFTHSDETRRKIAEGMKRAHGRNKTVGGYLLDVVEAIDEDDYEGALSRFNMALDTLGWPAVSRGPDVGHDIETAGMRLRSALKAGPSGNGQVKSATATATRVKSAPSSSETKGKGIVQAYVSIFGNTDLQGDRVVKGAFKKSIERWRASGDMPPVVFSHSWQDPWHHLGVVTHMEETDKGLRVEYELDVDENPVARQVHRLLSQRRITEHSYAYDVLDSRPGDDGATELLELSLIEVGPTLRGANPDTELLGVKSALAAARERSDYDPLAFDPETREPRRKSFIEARARERSHRTRAAATAAAPALVDAPGGGAALSGPAVIGGVLRCQHPDCSAMVQVHGHPSDRLVLCGEHAGWTPPRRGGHLDPRTGAWRPDPELASIDDELERLAEQRQRLERRRKEIAQQ